MDYKNEQVLIGSKHEKERAISSIFENKIGCDLHVSTLDTDLFGTFTGEIPRVQSAYETCVLKAKAAAIADGFTLCIANEGSFGPHPSIPFSPSDHEIMVFLDLKNNWVIADQLLTPKTNYKMLTMTPNTNIDSFLESVRFPSHALVLQLNDSKEILAKGINDFAVLMDLISKGFSQGDELLLTTDMRAMMNPTRMMVLSTLAKKLASRILTECLICRAPGFGIVSTSGNLPCELCDGPSSLYALEVWTCIACDNIENKLRSDQLKKASATYCNYCNP